VHSYSSLPIHDCRDPGGTQAGRLRKRMVWLILSLLSSFAQAQVSIVLLQPSDRVVPLGAYDAQIQPLVDSDPADSVARQATLEGKVILWVGTPSATSVGNLPTLISEAAKYPNIKYVYLYDELFWDKKTTVIGLHESEVLEGARLAHAAGPKTLVTILPDVILSPRFALRDINAFDGIAVDVYPSIRPTRPDLQGCRFSDNDLENLLYCSIRKLRAMGFAGEIGYIYQAFGLHSMSDDALRQHLLLQRTAINDAKAMGVSAVMPFGMYLGTGELKREPDLYPLGGTQFESLVRP